MIQIEESNPSFESCDKCIYSDDSEETCILRRCIHAVARLKECYVPKQPTIDPERKTGRWIHDGYAFKDGIDWMHCSECGHKDSWSVATRTPFCGWCGARMEDEG